MSAPKRWLDEAGGATRSERALLREGLSIEPPEGAADAIWSALAAKLPPPGGGPFSPASPEAPSPPAGPGANAEAGMRAVAGASVKGVVSVASGGILKSVLIGGGSALALITAYAVITPSAPPREPALSAATVSSPPGLAPASPRASLPAPAPEAPRMTAPELAAAPELAPPAPEAPPASAPVAPKAVREPAETAGQDAPSRSVGLAGPGADETSREDRLLEESRRLTEARGALRRGEVAQALDQLEELRRAFPAGVLGQEREALTIEALARSGRRAEAEARARAFLAQNPTSPHASRVKSYAP